MSDAYTGGTYCIGNENSQELNIQQDLTFENSTIYTNTWGSDNPEDAEWTVYHDNILSINNTVVKCGCPDKMWQGIRNYRGNATTVEIYDSEIHDAISAVTSAFGATAKANNSRFVNNQYDLRFFYTDYASIKNNEFITNDHLNNPDIYPIAHVYMKSTEGISFIGNEFKNSLSYRTNEYSHVNHRGIGIASLFSSYTVSPVIGPQQVLLGEPNKFTGLFYGVRARGVYDSPVRIHHSTFTDNFRGVYLNDIPAARVLFNTYETTNELPPFQWSGHSLNGTPDIDESYAVYLNACESFFLEENTAKNGDAGFYVYNTGDNVSRFYKNIFGGDPETGENFNMKAGAIAVGQNSNWNASNPPLTNIGLQIRCNDFDATGKAISVVNGNIRRNQGAENGETDELAGNQFSETLVNGLDFTAQVQENELFDFSSLDLGMYRYNHHDDDDPNSEVNGYYRELNVFSNVMLHTEIGKYYVGQLSCPSHFSLTLPDSDIVAEGLSDIRADRREYNNLQDDYSEIIDKGNTEYMKATAELINDENYSTAFEILQNEGYLTDTVLTAILCNNIAPESALVAILIENSPLPEKVIELVNEIELDESLKSLLLTYQDGVNNRVKLEYAMGDVLQRIAETETELINIASNNDSVQSVTDSVVQYLSPLALADHKYSLKKYKLHIIKGDYRTAQAELSNLDALSNELNDSLAAEINEFIRVENIHLLYLDKYDDAVISREIGYLEQMAMKESALYSAKAQNLLALIGDNPYFEYTPMPVEVINPKRMSNQANVEDLFMPQINIYPNPTEGILQVEYNFETLQREGMDLLLQVLGYSVQPDCEHGKLNIYTSQGRLLKSVAMNDLKGSKTIDLSEYTSGAYLIELNDCYGNNNSIKITKQ